LPKITWVLIEAILLRRLLAHHWLLGIALVLRHHGRAGLPIAARQCCVNFFLGKVLGLKKCYPFIYGSRRNAWILEN